MKFHVAFFIFLCLLFNITPAFYNNKKSSIEKYNLAYKYDPDYSQIFKYEYPTALKLLKENLQLFKNTCSTYNIDTAIAVSIVFPEFIRYSNYKDIIETHSLEVIYVNLGKEYIDFSIGLMQMKPSFAEKLENYVKTSANLSKKYDFIGKYTSATEKEIRSQRVARLKSVQWQLFYLCSFCDVVSERFSHSVYGSKAEKIKFYAATYNCDFLASEEKIIKQTKQRYFPYGKNWVMPQYSYSDVAADFYKHFYPDI